MNGDPARLPCQAVLNPGFWGRGAKKIKQDFLVRGEKNQTRFFGMIKHGF
jgi:hypothetical protein